MSSDWRSTRADSFFSQERFVLVFPNRFSLKKFLCFSVVVAILLHVQRSTDIMKHKMLPSVSPSFPIDETLIKLWVINLFDDNWICFLIRLNLILVILCESTPLVNKVSPAGLQAQEGRQHTGWNRRCNPAYRPGFAYRTTQIWHNSQGNHWRGEETIRFPNNENVQSQCPTCWSQRKEGQGSCWGWRSGCQEEEEEIIYFPFLSFNDMSTIVLFAYLFVLYASIFVLIVAENRGPSS